MLVFDDDEDDDEVNSADFSEDVEDDDEVKAIEFFGGWVAPDEVGELDSDIEEIDSNGMTPLLWAVLGNQFDLVEALLENGLYDIFKYTIDSNIANTLREIDLEDNNISISTKTNAIFLVDDGRSGIENDALQCALFNLDLKTATKMANIFFPEGDRCKYIDFAEMDNAGTYATQFLSKLRKRNRMAAHSEDAVTDLLGIVEILLEAGIANHIKVRISDCVLVVGVL